jgi:glycerophosphoryl diester phosphodiesterase
VGIDFAVQNSGGVMNPKVIAHRGASGYRPENTLAAFELGLALGADGIEFDVVNTADQFLVIRHENALSETTDVRDVAEFASLEREGLVNGKTITDWFVEDFTHEQLKNLRAIERLPDIRPGSAKFDGQFEIPSLKEVLESEFIREKIVVIELKHGTHLEALTESIGSLTTSVIASSDVLNKPVSLIIESFYLEILLDVQKHLVAAGIDAKYFLALDSTKLAELDITELAQNLDGLSIATHMLLSSDSWVEACHDLDLEVWVYTARAENATTTIEAYYEELIQTGVDGIFADQPDLLRRVLDERG